MRRITELGAKNNPGGRPPLGAGAASRRGQEGVVLLLVLGILVLLSVVVLSWAQEWRTEVKLTANYRDAQECRRLAEAGIFYALGKVAQAKGDESLGTQGGLGDLPSPGAGWRLDQTPQVIQLPRGKAEVRVADEAGKINLNQADELTLTNFLAVLGYSPDQVKTMVTAIMEWRQQEGEAVSPPSPFARRTSRRPMPMLAARQTRFDVPEEIAWVQGFENSPLVPRWSDWFTVQNTGRGINVNTAPQEVLESLGFSPDQARTIIASRQTATYRQSQELPPLPADPRRTQFQQTLTFKSSPFCTIKATGMINNKEARHTIKVVVRLDLTPESPWTILFWVDDFPG